MKNDPAYHLNIIIIIIIIIIIDRSVV
jgi:hypothetical protein